MSAALFRNSFTSTLIPWNVTRSTNAQAFANSCLQFLQLRFKGCEKLWDKIQTLSKPGVIQFANKTKGQYAAAESLAIDFKLVYQSNTVNVAVLAQGFHHWFQYCAKPNALGIQKAFTGLVDPYSKFEQEEFELDESLPIFETVCRWQMEPFPSQVDFKRRCAHMKEEINKLTYEYDTWDLSIGMGRLKLLQFMMTCIYAQNVFDDHLKEGQIEEVDTMPMKPIEIGKKRVQREEESAPEHERLMLPYSVLIQSSTVNVRFEFRAATKSKVDGGKNEVYKYSGIICRKNKEPERFARLTAAEIRSKTGLRLDSITSKKVPGADQTLTAIDGLESKLRIMEGDIEQMLSQFSAEIKTEISDIKADTTSILTEIKDLKRREMFPDSMSFSGCGENEELRQLKEQLKVKDRIIAQQAEEILMLRRFLDQANNK